MSKTKFYLGFGHFFVEVYKVLRLARKMSPRHPKCCNCHTESSSCPKSSSTTAWQNEIRDPFKTPSKVTKNCACHKKWPPKHLILTHACHAATRMKKCPLSCTRHAKQRLRLQHAPKVPCLQWKIDIAQKTSTARCELVKRDLWKRGLRDTRFVRACTVEMHMDISHENFCAVRVTKFAGHGWDHLEWTPDPP